MKQAQLSAMTPGSVCASVAYSTNSSWVIHFRSFTTSFWITGSIARPPAKVNVPALKNTQNRSFKVLNLVICMKKAFLSLALAAQQGIELHHGVPVARRRPRIHLFHPGEQPALTDAMLQQQVQ